MDDDADDKDDTKRKSRNLSEKKRRDQFNLLVNELSSMVSSSNRKMDKSTVLKSTIAFLKHHNEITVRSRVHEIQEDWKPSFLSNEEFTHLILEALDGFIIVFSSNGRIFYASESITSLLGHLPSDLLSSTIYDLAYEEDHSQLYNILLNPVPVIDPMQGAQLTFENQVSFSCHLKRSGLDYRDDVSYELVQFVGYFRSDVDLDSMLTSTRTCFTTEQETRLIFVGTGRIQTPQLIREMSIVDSTKSEFTSRHSLEWKFLFLDHRASPIIGYLPFEVLGTSGYDYYHFDDLDKVILCHEALMQKGEGKSCFYRFLTKGQQWIWLQTRFYITYHQWNSKPEFVVCTHRVVSHTDVMKQIRNTSSAVMQNAASLSQQMKDANSEMGGGDMSTTSNSSAAPGTKWVRSSRTSKYSMNAGSSSSMKSRSRHSMSYGNGSDSTSMSADSRSSRNSAMTQYSSRSRIRQHSQPHQKMLLQQQQQQQQKQQLQQQQTQRDQVQQHHLATATMIHHPIQTNYSPHPMQLQQNLTPISSSAVIGETFIEPQQYITAIPVQPVLATGFAAAPTAVMSPIAVNVNPDILSPGMVMTPNQSHIQDQLQRKHEELQKLIVQQQEELRRVSEQLLMARYGLLPQIVDGPVNFQNTTPPQQVQQQGMNRSSASSLSDHQMQQSQGSQIIQHHQLGSMHSTQGGSHHDISSSSVAGSISLSSDHHSTLEHHITPHQSHQPQHHHEQHQRDQHQHQQQSQQQQQQQQMDPMMSNQMSTHENEMISYMQLSNVSNTHIANINLAGSIQEQQDHQHQHHQQSHQQSQHINQNHQRQIQIPNELEILPYQMSTEQSQLLFGSPTSSSRQSQ